jgi:hypothetical protein
VLHARFLRLGNASGTLEVLGHESLTRAAGAHPLFTGVRELLVRLPAEPEVEQAEDRLVVRAEGLTLALEGARLERSGQELVVRLRDASR